MGRPAKNAPAPPTLTPIVAGPSVSEQIIKSLTTYIFSEGLAPGQRLPSERQLSETLGVTRSAVRDAIQSLGLVGIVDVRPGDGTYLREEGLSTFPAAIEWGLFLGERRVMDLVEARQQIEISLVGFAAQRRTEEQLARIARAVESMRDPQIASAEFVDSDVEFHLAIAAASGNSALADVLSNISSLLRAWMTRSIKAAGETQSSYLEHVAIFDAISNSDARGARAAMRVHMNHAESRLRKTLADSPAALVRPGPQGDEIKD